MAKEIVIEPPQPNPRARLLKKLATAPNDHAEALLDLLEVAQLLRDKGILELAKGILGSGEKVLELMTETIQTEQALAMIRNVTILTKIVGGLNPAVLEEVEAGLIRSVNKARAEKPPSIFKIMKMLTSEDSRRALSTIAGALESLGKNMAIADVSGRKRKKTYKHNA